MNNIYKCGDFVTLRESSNYTCEFWPKNVKIYQITKLTEEGVKLRNIKEDVSFEDILPIPINGDDDRWIYYDPLMAASLVLPGQRLPIRKTDYSYYLDGLKRMHIGDTDKTLYDVVVEKKFKFVHEVQQCLRRGRVWEDLKINEYKR